MTVGYLVSEINFDRVHICVKRRANDILIPLGGGSPEDVLRRFGLFDICYIYVADNVVNIVIKG